MGKLVTFVTILIFIDLLFLATGQLVLESPSSVILAALIDPSAITSANFWAVLIDGLSILAITTAVVAGLVTRSSDILIFVAMGTSLALLIGDYVAIFAYLYAINTTFAVLLMAPVIAIFGLIIVEWVRGKD